MAPRIHQYVPGSRRYGPTPGRIILLSMVTCALWGAGLAAGAWAATVSLAAARSGQDISWVPWMVAFVLIVSGMLSVVYGFFFRPRALELSEEEVALIQWDGKGEAMRRSEVKAVEAGTSRLVLKGEGRDVVIPRLFEGWDEVRTSLSGWRAG